MNARRLLAVLALAGALPLGGCITYPPGWNVEEQGRDPYQPVNRPIFAFNKGVDDYVLRPVSKGWAFVTPRQVRVSLRKFFVNLQFPRRLLANLGQGEVVQAGSEMGRFLLNTTLGLAGFFDPATHFGMEFYDEDFGQMFGRWGVPAGPYWVVPVLGPSNPRDAFGSIFDLALDGRNAVTGLGALATVNDRALADPAIELAKETALDLYVFTRDGFIERRRALVANENLDAGMAQTAASDDLYDFDVELEEDDEEVEPGEVADHEAEEFDGAHGSGSVEDAAPAP